MSKALSLRINSIGTSLERQSYQTALTAFLSEHKAQLDDESLMRLDKNPLRILDSKNKSIQALLTDAPNLHDYLSQDSLARFDELCSGLDTLGIAYTHEPNLVRGLDYYSHTVFEWVTDRLGAQGAVSAGGRYDGLVSQLGGKHTPAAGFAIGMERLVLLLLEIQGACEPANCDVYVIIEKTVSQTAAIAFVDGLRSNCTHLSLMTDLAQSSMKSQLKRAQASQATYALIFTREILAQGQVTLKELSGMRDSQILSLDNLIQHFKVMEK